MEIILSGLIAALGALITNKLLAKSTTTAVAIYLSSFIEELFKSFTAYLMGTSLPLVHLIFGSLEAIFDFYSARQGIWAGLSSIIHHTIFGYLTLFIYLRFNLLIAVLIVGAIHLILNHLILNLIRG